MADYAADVPTSIGSAGQVLKVNSGGTAYEWAAIGDALPAGASAGQVLKRNAGNTDYEWGDAESAINVDSSGNPTLGTGVTALELRTLMNAQATAEGVAAPDWSSPSSTYTTGGTWSKPSGLANDAIVWVYMVSGGTGGGTASDAGGNNSIANGGRGGYAAMVQVKASNLDGSAYVIGAGGTGASAGTTSNGGNGGATYITINSTVYSAGETTPNGVNGHTGYTNISGQSGAGSTELANYFQIVYPSLYTEGFTGSLLGVTPIYNVSNNDAIFAGGSGSQMYWDSSGGPLGQDSVYAGDAGDNPGNGGGAGQGSNQQGTLPSIPGGGGSPARGTHPSWGSTSSPAARDGAQGNIRFYHA